MSNKSCTSLPGNLHDVWFDTDAEFTQEDELEREWNSRREEHWNAGYRDGAEEGRTVRMKEGFLEGFAKGSQAGFQCGKLRGSLEGLMRLGPSTADQATQAEAERIARELSKVSPDVELWPALTDPAAGGSRPEAAEEGPLEGSLGRLRIGERGEGSSELGLSPQPGCTAEGGEEEEAEAPRATDPPMVWRCILRLSARVSGRGRTILSANQRLPPSAGSREPTTAAAAGGRIGLRSALGGEAEGGDGKEKRRPW
eukprot:CAMPEP_0177611936 /NCGR_PEP_ID=MMETSP0419_2-20121207/20867_1 /TAXON_ID=582737 /ORGANISM="Tetraselmis sp., Strain GSL018" /LENGTH=254 /DNA_ID=CAMNT_0019107919 /DNA_START=173 /DNA_END=935 /DNA_ORIENTATION=-